MNFLSRFSSLREPAQEAEAMPARRRTFSAAQFRDEEVARAAELQARREAAEAEAIAAAEASRAERLAEAEADSESADDDEAASDEPPMEWEEAVGWLSTRSAEARDFIAQNWNWEHDIRVLHFLVQQPDMDMGVATGIFWLTGATDDFFPWGDEDCPSDPQFKRAAEMVDTLGRRFAAEDFQSARFGFDDSWDCTTLKERLEELYLDGRIDWSPATLPTVSPGPQPTMDDVPEGERSDVLAFLAGHGAL
ncbi:MAG TPA: DUF4274 domain-containing protein [Sphingomicrobium sp.]|nr:DUF4274 domain-containing protein [Sphingomicrobium sp.]